MHINEIDSNSPMGKLFEEVKILLGDNSVCINYINNLDDLDDRESRVNAGSCAKILPNGAWRIEICKDEPFIDYILSHELLHVLLDTKGFPNTYFIDANICCQFSDDMGNMIKNIVIHKVIIQEQLSRGFNIVDAPKKKLKNVVETWPNITNLTDSTLWYLLALTSFMIEAEFCLSEYESAIDIKNPILYKSAKFLYEVIIEQKLETPYKTRKVLIKVLKKFDELLVENNIAPLKLFEKLLIRFIPTEWQLQLKVNQVFNVRKSSKDDSLFLFTNSEGQLSFDFQNGAQEAVLQEIQNMTIESLLKMSYGNYVVHKTKK